jgi:putative phage-type endonuclease
VKIVSLKQNTRDWYTWRGKGLGASEAPTVMGVSEWETRFELWAYKTSLLAKPEPNVFAAAAMQRGHDLEDGARTRAERQLGITFEPLAAEHDVHACIRASLDGCNLEKRCFLEIKCPGKAAHTEALKGRVPEKYFPQLQQQFLVTGFPEAFYASWDGLSDDVVIVPVKPDPAYLAELERTLVEFWQLVETKTAPRVDATDLAKLVERIGKQFKQLSQCMAALEILNNAFTANKFHVGGAVK